MTAQGLAMDTEIVIRTRLLYAVDNNDVCHVRHYLY